ncbi:pirin family protein [Aeoliella mucimassa]|uniref:Quercetin 2,3-dioxygenase n=1 Tax=Aeoliella mucimassa TaxID=2527972 RepID=A0A518AJL1_9BACT|nr:pirin family protein [Aeoliella mucimassa]QDU54922.1 Quercetin 2,3-dioxygenase [Aeoliella mucimassa]
MLTIRRAHDRGHANHGWLETYHTFSFANYFDPDHVGFRSLRVINEDRVAPGEGFGTHAHYDIEIVTYVLGGALEHKDSMGNTQVLHAGEFQRITAGSGITHSEYNPSGDQPVHFYQIWLHPRAKNLTPVYEQKGFASDARQNRLQLVASADGRDNSLLVNQDANIYLVDLQPAKSCHHTLPTGRYAWLQVLAGQVTLNGETLGTSDGASVTDESELTITASQDAKLMLFDLA